MSNERKHAAFAFLLIILFALPATAFPANLLFAYPALSGAQAVYWIAYEHGLFKKHNLDVQLIYIGGSTRSTQALVSGDIKVTGGGGFAAVSANLAGSDVVMIEGLVQTLPFALAAVPEIKQPKDLLGKSVGISAIGGSADIAARYLLEKLSLRPIKDVAMRVIPGSYPDRIAAMEKRIVHAIPLDPTFVPAAQRMGAHVLIDMLSLERPYQYPNITVVTTRSYISSNTNEVRGTVRALIEGIYHLKTMKSEAIRIMGKYLRTDDAQFLASTYALYNKLFLSVPYISMESVRNVFEQIPSTSQKTKEISPQSFMDMRFVKEAEEEGFISNLYKSP
jgi:NitT/TauT family transport system substrate-binding protein